MSAYIFAMVKNITDHEQYSKYAKANSEIVKQYGGRFLYRNGHRELIEGSPISERVVIVEFASMEDAKRWYYSPEYTEARAMRDGIAEASIYVLNSYDLEPFQA